MTAIRRKERVLSSERHSSPPRGYVPILVGDYDDDEEEAERFFVHVNMLEDPCIRELLEMAAEAFCYRQEGVLRIPCKVEHFLKTVEEIGGD